MKKCLFLTMLVFTAFFAIGQDSSNVKQKGETVKPVKVWKNGKTMDATDIKLTVVYEDLESYATLYYVLKDSTGVTLSDGNINVDEEDYKKWVVAPNRIKWVYNFSIRFLKLEELQQKQAK